MLAIMPTSQGVVNYANKCPLCTSIHAASTAIAFEQLALLVKESTAGRDLPRTDILELLHGAIDVMIQVGVEQGRRSLTQIHYRDTAS
jgi:type IV secretion system protein VirB11